MSPYEQAGDRKDEAVATGPQEHTRRALLGKAALVGGGFGVASLGGAEGAKAETTLNLAEFPTGSIMERALASATAAGATTITLSSAPSITGSSLTLVAIDPFTTSCELRIVLSVSGSTLTLGTGTTALAAKPLSYAHGSGAAVLFFQGNSVPAAWFGAKSDNLTDDTTAIQNGLIETYRIGLWLDGQGRQSIVSQPVLLPPSCYLRHITLKAVSFAPADVNNALLMNMQGSILSFNAGASTDTFTTSTPHGLPSDGVGVVFKGSSLPAGITAGRVYYCRDRTSTTFRVALTRGGSAVNLSANGAGTVYCEVLSLQKVALDDVYIKGNDTPGLTGAALTLQQPSFITKLRIDNCPDTGLVLNGQQAHFENLEIIACGTGLALEGASFMYFFSTNIENGTATAAKAIHVRSSGSARVFGSGGATSCLWHGVHLEHVGSAPASFVAFDLEGSSLNLDWVNVNMSMNVAGQKGWYVHTGSASSSSYSIHGVNFASHVSSSGIVAIKDSDRSIRLDQWDDYRYYIHEFSAPIMPTSHLYPDLNPFMIAGPGGRYLKYGGTIDSVSTVSSKPGRSQTAHQCVYRDVDGSPRSGFNKGAYPWIGLNSPPADAEIQPGRVFMWFDPTNGAAKVMFKGKQSDGKVLSGEVPLK
jgi:hypothetical protein